MATISPTELTFLRLLERTKRLTKENLSLNVWKVSAATKVLNNLIAQMQDDSDNDMLIHYRREVVQLKLLAEAENKVSSEESLKVIEKIPRFFPNVQVNVVDSDAKENIGDQLNKESAAGIRSMQRSIYRSDLRKQLFSTSNKNANNNSEDDFMKHEKLEENLANDLLSVTKSLKTIMTSAGEVIKEDNKKLTHMQNRIESNKAALETESSRLAHHAYKCGFDCMRIFIVVFVFWTFISMVIMMKVFPKRVVY